MIELYKIHTDGRILKIEGASFYDEPKELETFIMKNEGILGNVVLLNHQISLPDGKRIDIWGLDTLELRPLIIELKNVTTGIDIIPQILPYYNFVKSHPDTLKFKALSNNKFMKKLKSLGIGRDKLEKGLEEDPKVILIAPNFKDELLDVVDYIKFDVELVEISRYKTEEGEFFATVDRPQSRIMPPVKVRVMEEWTWEKYEKEGISKKKINIAQGLKGQIDNIIESERLNLQPVFRKLYVPYQFGRNNVLWIDLGYTSWETGDVLLNVKLDAKPNLREEGIEIEHTKTKWYEDYNQWVIYFKKIVDLTPLIPIIRRSYEYVTGEKIPELGM